MAVRRPITLQTNLFVTPTETNIIEYADDFMVDIREFSGWVHSQYPSTELATTGTSGTVMPNQNFTDTYYIAGNYVTRVDRFATEAETPNISMVTDVYNRIRVIDNTGTEPTGDTNNFQFPLYRDANNNFRAMTRQDFIDTFVTPSIPIITNGGTGLGQGGTYFMTTSANPTGGVIVSTTPAAVNSVADLNAYTSGGIPEANKQTIDINYYIARVQYSDDAYLPITDYMPLYFNPGDENIYQHTPESWAALLGPFLQYYIGSSPQYKISYNINGSGSDRGSIFVDSRRTPTGTGYTQRYVNVDDYRTQEFPTGTESVVAGSSKVLRMVIGTSATFSLSSNPVGTVTEGNSVTFTMNTTGVSDGTQLSYEITGISQADLSSGNLTGFITINSNTGSVVVTLADDGLTEGSETLTFTCAGQSVQLTVNDPGIAAGTFTGDSAPDTTVDSKLDEVSSGGETVNPSSTIRFRFSRQNIGGTSGFRITVEEGNAGAISNWYNTSGVPTSLSTTPVTLYENTTAVPTEIMMEWTETVDTQAGNSSSFVTGYTEGIWTNTPSDGTEIAALFTNQTTAGAGAFSQLVNSHTINFWGRAAGSASTLLASFVLVQETSADASAF